MVKLHNLPSTKQATRRRVGRGNSSRGTYSGRGIKGQKARTGGRGGLKLKGAKQTILRLPKTRGFKSVHQKMAVVNVKELGVFGAKEVVEPKALVQKGLISTARFGVKVLGEGALANGLTVKAHAFTDAAKAAIEKAGGKVEVIKSKRGRDPKEKHEAKLKDQAEAREEASKAKAEKAEKAGEKKAASKKGKKGAPKAAGKKSKTSAK